MRRMTSRQLSITLSLVFSLAIAGCDDSETRGDLGDDDGGTGYQDTETEEGKDIDGDGFTPDQGDCNDFEPHINPDAVEDLGAAGTGDGVDNDCDGETDEVEECDCPQVGTAAQDLASGFEMCDPRFLIGVEKISSSSGGEAGFDTLVSQGTNDCIVTRQGCEMTAISTGPVGQADPNMAEDMGGMMADVALDPLPEYQGDQATTAEPYASCDVSQIRMELKAPSNGYGFSFDFLFGSAEYDEWIEQGFNDTFYAILEYAGQNGGAPTNIAFDDNGNEIEVDTNFFENPSHPCDETGSGWEPAMPSVSGSTGWLRTAWNVQPGAVFALTFSIHDEGDCIYDSITFIDNFRWSTTPVDPGTTPLE